MHGEKIKLNQNNLRFGRGFHQACLEPDKFDWKEYTGAERALIIRMQSAYFANVPERNRQGYKEASIEYDLDGWRCKMVADILDSDVSGVITDLKTTSKRSYLDFERSIIEYDYHRQGAFYLDCPLIADVVDTFRIIAVTKEKNPAVYVYSFRSDHPLIEEGRKEYRFLLEQMGDNGAFEKYRIQPT